MKDLHNLGLTIGGKYIPQDFHGFLLLENMGAVLSSCSEVRETESRSVGLGQGQ